MPRLHLSAVQFGGVPAAFASVGLASLCETSRCDYGIRVGILIVTRYHAGGPASLLLVSPHLMHSFVERAEFKIPHFKLACRHNLRSHC